MSNKILIFLLYVVLLEYYFGCASPGTYYQVTKQNEKSKNNIQNEDTKSKQNIKHYDYIDKEKIDDYKEDDDYQEDDHKCVPKSSSCICKCTKNKVYNCDECLVLRESSTGICIPGEIIQFFCPDCPCDENGRHVCEKCYQKRLNAKISNNFEDNNNMYRKKREADSFYDYLYNKDPLPLSTEQIRELQRQTYLQRRQDVIDKRREKQELIEQQAELARQQAEMRKELEYQRRLDEEQRALDAQQDYIDDYVYEDTNLQEQDDYFTKKISDKKNRF